MTVYTRAQIEGFARTAGLNDKDAKTASYIAMAESGGDTDKPNHYTINGQTYYVDGLWQISTIHNLGSRESMRDPMTNARAMAKLHADAIAAGKDPWHDWSSSKDGKNGWGSKVLGVLNKIDTLGGLLGGAQPGGADTRAALDAQTGQAADQAIDGTMGIAHALESIVAAVDKAGNWLANPHNWLRIAYVGLGAGVVITGLVKLVGYDAGLSPVGAMAKMNKSAPVSRTEEAA